MRTQKSDARRRVRGFTLIELLVVIAIISLLVSILLPSLNRAKMMAKEVVCLSNIKQIGLACNFYANANNDCMPVFLATYDPGSLAPGDTIPNYMWMQLLSEFAGEKTHQNYSQSATYYEYAAVFHGCPEYKFQPKAAWEPGYGMISIMFNDSKKWYHTNIYNWDQPSLSSWGGGAAGGFSRRAELTQPSKIGWMTDSGLNAIAGYICVGGDPGFQEIYDPNNATDGPLYPGFPKGFWGGVPDPDRHGGRSCILFADGHAQAYTGKTAGWAFSDYSRLPD